MDFKVGEDLVGLRGVAFADLSFTQVGADTLLKVAGFEVGHFANMNAGVLNNQANFSGLV
jgi:glycerophosphoryl diester phosphodiesterase